MIDCIEPNCNKKCLDPCVKVNTLFKTKLNLLTRSSILPEKELEESILKINDQLVEVGLQDHEHHFELFRDAMQKKEVKVNEAMLFILVCTDGHRNEYNITCP